MDELIVLIFAVAVVIFVAAVFVVAVLVNTITELGIRVWVFLVEYVERWFYNERK